MIPIVTRILYLSDFVLLPCQVLVATCHAIPVISIDDLLYRYGIVRDRDIKERDDVIANVR